MESLSQLSVVELHYLYDEISSRKDEKSLELTKLILREIERRDITKSRPY